MLLREITDVLERIAPLEWAEPWDNVGLLVGDESQTVTRAILCIDYTDAVAIEAKEMGCELVIAYHPTLFKPVSRLIAAGATKLLFDAARRGVAIYSPHTALDVAPGGTNDVLADIVVMRDRRPLRLSEPKSAHLKLVVFVPRANTDAVCAAMFDAGAGHIGRYDSCSFRTPGTGTFRGEAGTNPAIGIPGRLERVDEDRVETIVPQRLLSRVIDAMRKAHPYEEVAFDVYPLAQAGEINGMGAGMGRVGNVPEGSTIEMMLNRVKRELGVDHLLVSGDVERSLRKVAVCAGAGGDLLNEVIAEKVDLYLTGELRHHDALRARSAGVTVACALHSNSERVALNALSARLAKELPTLQLKQAMTDRDPFSIL